MPSLKIRGKAKHLKFETKNLRPSFTLIYTKERER